MRDERQLYPYLNVLYFFVRSFACALCVCELCVGVTVREYESKRSFLYMYLRALNAMWFG